MTWREEAIVEHLCVEMPGHSYRGKNDLVIALVLRLTAGRRSGRGLRWGRKMTSLDPERELTTSRD